MSPKKRKQFPRKRTKGSSLELSVPTYGCTGFCERENLKGSSLTGFLQEKKKGNPK
jgi:hypothetical protein